MCVIGIMMFCHYVSAFSLYYRSTLSEKEGWTKGAQGENFSGSWLGKHQQPFSLGLIIVNSWIPM